MSPEERQETRDLFHSLKGRQNHYLLGMLFSRMMQTDPVNLRDDIEQTIKSCDPIEGCGSLPQYTKETK